MKQAFFGTLALLFTLSQAVTLSQAPPKTATDVTNAEIQTILKMAQTDQQLKVVDIGKYNVGVGILHRGAVCQRAFGLLDTKCDLVERNRVLR